MTSITQKPLPDHGEVDVVMTSGPPKGILHHCPQGDVGCSKLLQALTRARPLLHCFGHIHEGSGAMLLKRTSPKPSIESHLPNDFPEPILPEFVPGEATLTVNTAINDRANTPTSAPWLVNLLLPKAEMI